MYTPMPNPPHTNIAMEVNNHMNYKQKEIAVMGKWGGCCFLL